VDAWTVGRVNLYLALQRFYDGPITLKPWGDTSVYLQGSVLDTDPADEVFTVKLESGDRVALRLVNVAGLRKPDGRRVRVSRTRAVWREASGGWNVKLRRGEQIERGDTLTVWASLQPDEVGGHINLEFVDGPQIQLDRGPQAASILSGRAP
jgi:hypothetical protein